jgi:hypothetical protein
MKKFSFTVDMVADDLNIETTKNGIQQFLAERHEDVVSQVKSAGVKSFSEQGFKVWRARVTGVTAKQAGDAHNPKVKVTAE